MDTHASFNENDELIECYKSNITLIVDEITFGIGTLYVAESKLYWKNNANSQVISINYDIMCEFDVSNHPEVHEKPCLEMTVDFNYTPGDNEVDKNEDEEEEGLKSIIKLVPDNPECLNEIFEAITCIQPLHYRNYVDDEDEVEGSDRESNSTDISLRESDEHLADISSRESDEHLADISSRESDEHLADTSLSESDEHEDSDKNSYISISSTSTREDQEAGSIDISNQYHKLDAKNGEKENQANSIKCLDIPHSPSDSLDDNEYSDNSENDDLELHNIRSPASYFNISSRAPIHSNTDLDIESEDDILLQDEEVLINERKRKFEDLPEQDEKPTKIRKLWNFMKYPFQKITSDSTSISENEPNISIDEVITGEKNSLEPETAVCENNSDSVKAEEKNSENNSEADGENEDTSTNEISRKFCKIM